MTYNNDTARWATHAELDALLRGGEPTAADYERYATADAKTESTDAGPTS